MQKNNYSKRIGSANHEPHEKIKSKNGNEMDNSECFLGYVPSKHQDEELVSLIKSAHSRTKYKTFILSSTVFEVEQRFQVNDVIGQGAYGVVCSGYDLLTKQKVAIKKIEKTFEHKSLAKRTLRELKFLRYFNHENIINLLRVMRPNKSSLKIYMVSELLETDLAMVIRSPQTLTDEHCQFFLYQVLRGLKYIHSASVIHRDLKPRNLLVNSNCDLKICDLGLARTLVSEDETATMSNYIATRWYRAPEICFSRAKYTQAVDMWAVGCILAELLIRRPLFPGRDSFHQISLIISILGTPNDIDDDDKKENSRYRINPGQLSSRGSKSERQIKKKREKKLGFMRGLPKKPSIPLCQVIPDASPVALDLLNKLLVFDPDKRLTVTQALKHPYLSELHFEEDEPTCDSLDMQDFYFDYFKTSKKEMKILILQEILCNYPEDTFRLENDIPSFQFSSQPNGLKRGRRKSFP